MYCNVRVINPSICYTNKYTNISSDMLGLINVGLFINISEDRNTIPRLLIDTIK